MATVETVGPGKTRTTLQLWEDNVPATPTGGYIGECYTTEFTAGVTIAGHTTSATDFIRLTCATGESFQDNPSVRSNALFYNAANGVAVAANPFSAPVIDVQNDFVEIRRLQIKRTALNYNKPAVSFNAGQPNSFIKDCIVEKAYNATDAVVDLRESKGYNTIAIDTGGGASAGFNLFNAGGGVGTAVNCTSVRSSALGASGTGFGASATYTNAEVRNCASFGWTNGFSASGWNAANCSRNATDSASAPGSNNQTSKTFANQFVDTTNDFRLKAGSDCIDTGNTDATNAPNDISGTARGAGTAGDIGAWEFVAAAAALVLPPQRGQALMIRRERVLQKGGGKSETYSSIRGQPFAALLPVDNTPQPTGAQNVPGIPPMPKVMMLEPWRRGPFTGPQPARTAPVVAGAVLAGNAQDVATATGALSTAIPLLGAAAVVSTATGALTTAIPLQGSMAAVATMQGDLLTEIRLSGAAIAQALATGALDTAIKLAGDAQDVATMAGSLTTQITLSGAAIAQALMTGDLTTSGGSTALAGAAQAQASAAGSLTTQIPLVGDAVAVAGMQGALLTGIPLQGAAQDQSSMAGGITTRIQLQGAAAAVVSGNGGLTTSIKLSAAAAAQAIAAGGLTTLIRLNGAALAQVFATGSLVELTPPVVDPRFEALANGRRYANVAGARLWRSSALGRSYAAVMPRRFYAQASGRQWRAA